MNAIVLRSDTIYKHQTQLSNLIKDIKVKYMLNEAPLHQYYKNTFNLVDLADRYWYKVADSHHNYSWKSKMLYALLRFAMINFWAYANKFTGERWTLFRLTLARTLMTYQCK